MKKKVRIKYTDIVKAVSKALYGHFDEEIPIMDVVKDHPRPAFFTRLDVEMTGRMMTRHIDDEVAMRIYFYPSTMDNNEIELLEMQNELQYLFLVKMNSVLPLESGVNIEITDVGTGMVDDVLHYYLFMTISQGIEEDDKDINYMENIDLDRKVMNIHPEDGITMEEKENQE